MIKCVVVAIFVLIFQSCSTQNSKKWYKGNTHVHTVLCGHADSSPERVTRWYHDHGYNFLILSEHNIFIDPKEVKMPENKREDFILIPGEEVTGKRHVHTTAMNVNRLVDWRYTDKERWKIIQHQVDDIEAAGGVTILNHPNYHNALVPADVFPVDRLYMFELFNNLWEDRKFKDDDPLHPGEEVWWDRMLSEGMIMYGVGSDDAHKFRTFALKESNPGRGWVMVRSASLNPEAITAAMHNGDFYASSGVYLKEYEYKNNIISIEVDTEETALEMTKPIVRQGKKISKGIPGYKIELIGKKGKILETVFGTKARFNINNDSPYFRVKVSYYHKDKERGLEGYYAWCQPVFTDDRLKKKKFPHQYLNHSHNHPHDH